LGIITRPEALESSFLPEKLLHREKEIEALNSIVVEPLVRGNSAFAVVFGPPGTGKTVTCKHVVKQPGEWIGVYENFLAFGSIKNLLRDVLLRVGRVTLPGGMNMESQFRALKSYQSRTGKKLLLVIDECLNAFRDKKGIYNLLRANELHSLDIAVIFVSVDNPFLVMLSGTDRRLFSPGMIKFQKYSTDELEGILQNRYSTACRTGSVSPETLRFIAETASGSGSARVAIELLQKSAYLAAHRSSDTVDPEDVRAAMAFINPYLTESKLSELDFTDLIILLAVCRSLGSQPETGVTAVRETLDIACEEYGISRLEPHAVYGGLRELERMGLIESRLEKPDRDMGPTKIIRLSDVPAALLREKIETLIRTVS
jgi:cell division control protein 6